MTKILNSIDLSTLESAILALKQGLEKNPPSELERDGVIQRFEFSFELSWKIIRKVLIELGRSDVSASPRPILRGGTEEGLITNIEDWMVFLEARNSIAHTYSSQTAQKVYEHAKSFLVSAENLLVNLKKL